MESVNCIWMTSSDRTTSPLVRGDLKSPSCESLAWLRKFARDEKQMHYRLVSASADLQIEHVA